MVGGCSVAGPEHEPSRTPTSEPAAIATPQSVIPTDQAEPRITVSTPSPSAVPTPSTPAVLQAFALNLYEAGDFVPQYTFDWCVAASIQMAYNLVEPERRTARADQEQLWELARSQSSNSFGGANPWGWAAVLNDVGIGPYELVSIPDYDEALRVAAAAIVATQRPVGLVMWRGRHAWVMSGFESVGDPAADAGFLVTGVRVLDPLYPHGSGVWGPSPEPNSLLGPAELAKQFVIRDSRRWSSGLSPGYLLVLPVPAEVSAGQQRRSQWPPFEGEPRTSSS
ncbi:MAG TPA: hypothetical protein VEW45_06515 [Candidatus Dormibacteraeota bacterium]|nr:hypothetical protein [Candidatus Dormibacteraeota bacterium]